LETTWRKFFVLGFFGVNDDAKVDLGNTQIMCYIFCYQNHVIGINPRTQVRQILNFYYKTNGIISFKKHADAKHTFIAKRFEEKMNNMLKVIEKKRINMFGRIFFFNSMKDSFIKEDVSQKKFLEDFGLLIIKNNLLIQVVKHI
jgi:hypothetical protein